MTLTMPKAYEGDRPYIFVDYAHADRDAVLPIIRALVDEGYRVWWDDGVEPTTDYSEYLADHVYGCDCLVMFVSKASVGSEWCRQEVLYAIGLGKKVLPIYLQDVELTRGLQMRMGGKQALFWYKYDSDDTFYKKLFRARRLESCLKEEGKRARGVKPRGSGTEANRVEASRSAPAQAESKAVFKAALKTDAMSSAGSKTEPTIDPKVEPGTELKANSMSMSKAETKNEAAQGSGADQLGSMCSLHASRQGSGGAAPNGCEERHAREVVVGKLGGVPVIVKNASSLTTRGRSSRCCRA